MKEWQERQENLDGILSKIDSIMSELDRMQEQKGEQWER